LFVHFITGKTQNSHNRVLTCDLDAVPLLCTCGTVAHRRVTDQDGIPFLLFTVNKKV